MLNDLEWCLTLAALEVESWEVEKLLKSNKSKVWKHDSCLFSDLLLKPSETLRWLLVYSKETWLAESKKIIKNRLILMRLQRWHTSFSQKYNKLRQDGIYPSCAWLSAWPLRKPRCIDDQVERDLKLAKNERKTIEHIQESSKDPQKTEIMWSRIISYQMNLKTL